MMKVEAFIHPFKLDEVKAALAGLGVHGVMYSQVLCPPAEGAPVVHYRGAKYRVDVPVIKVEILSSSLLVDELIEILARSARTEEAGNDGLILVYEVADAIQIHTGTRAEFILH